MCVRDLRRGGSCQRTKKKTFKAKLQRSDSYKVLCRESYPQALTRLDVVDLFCSELLPTSDPVKYHHHARAAAADVSEFLRDEPRIPVPLLPIKPTATAARSSPLSKVSALICSSKSSSNHLVTELRGGIDHNGRTASMVYFAADHNVVDNNAESNKFCPKPEAQSVIQATQGRAPQSDHEKTQTSIRLGVSLQSKFSHFEGRSTQPCDGPSEGQQYEARASSLSPCDVTSATSCNAQRQEGLLTTSLVGSVESPGGTTTQFCEVIRSLLEREAETCYQLPKPYVERLRENPAQKPGHNELRATRRSIVKRIFEVMNLLGLSSLAGAHAVSILDRYLSLNLLPAQQHGGGNADIPLAATACIWIAAKLEDITAADRYLPSIRSFSCFDFKEEKIREMEMAVLKCLGWRMLGATACDFLANMVAQLPAFGLPSHLLQPVGDRSEKIIQGILSEVEYLAYQPSVVSISVMQYLLEQCVPKQTVSIMEAFYLALTLDVL